MENKEMSRFKAMEIVKDSKSKYILVSVGGKRPQLISQNTNLPDLLVCTVRMFEQFGRLLCSDAGTEFNATECLKISEIIGSTAVIYNEQINKLWVYSKEPSSLDIVANQTSKYILWNIVNYNNFAIHQNTECEELSRITMLMMIELAKETYKMIHGDVEGQLSEESIQNSAYSMAKCVVKKLEKEGAAK